MIYAKNQSSGILHYRELFILTVILWEKPYTSARTRKGLICPCFMHCKRSCAIH